jgi:hypothetical protein
MATLQSESSLVVGDAMFEVIHLGIAPHHCFMQLHNALQANRDRRRSIVVTEIDCPISATPPPC